MAPVCAHPSACSRAPLTPPPSFPPAAGIPWSVLRTYSSVSAKEKARKNVVCERTELLEGKWGGELQRCPSFGGLGAFIGAFPFRVAIRKRFGTGNAHSLLKDVGFPQTCWLS